jgi:hypothetical protein
MSKPAKENPYERLAQTRKAMSLVGALDSMLLRQNVNPHTDALRIVLLIDHEWKTEDPWLALADAAKVIPPGDDTKKIVRKIYADRVRKPIQPLVIQ